MSRNMRSRRRTRSSSRRRYDSSVYIDGNTVRKVEVRPARRKAVRRKPVEVIPERPHRAVHMSPGYVVFLVASILVAASVLIWYVRLRSEITASQKVISKLETQYSTLKQSNDEEYDRILASVDLEEIKKKAMTEYGMKYPDENQVVGISGKDDDYVRQYGKIPDKKQ
ncbi:MAG: cell division protein FtsL [Lachnospiraceae bacterium]|nr:cell division protein FtsL [Lachnospiraceae bacterium]